MNIYDYQAAFAAWDKTSDAMRKAIREWFTLYYRDTADGESDPCQRIAYTVVSKLVKTVFSEYRASADDPVLAQAIRALDEKRKQALQLALVGGECYIKPCLGADGFSFQLIPRDQILIFARSAGGDPTDVGLVQHSTFGNHYYTLLERRRMDGQGYLTIENRLYRSANAHTLGQQVSLDTQPEHAALAERYTYERPVGSVGLVRLYTPMLNCVDGSADSVSVYAAAAGLIRNIDRNEALLCGEFERGQSRIIASSDMLQNGLTDHLFVGLDDDPERVGITVFAPELREAAFLARKQEYLRNVESVIGLKRGLLSDANVEKRTATEIASSQGEHALTALDFQQMWQLAAEQVAALCRQLCTLYSLAPIKDTAVHIDWGNGELYDEDKLWLDYQGMVASGLLMPEVALGWRFGMPADTPEQRAAIREKYMPN